MIFPIDLRHLPVIPDELLQEIPPDQQEIFHPELVGAAGQLGERPAGLEYLVAKTEDGLEQPGGLLGAVVVVLQRGPFRLLGPDFS